MTKLDESPYTILGISKDSDHEAIKKAYRKLALKWHPDKHQEDKDKEVAERKFKKIAQAYEILTDSKKKAALDRDVSGVRPGRRVFRDDIFRSPFDVFKDFFGTRDPFQDIFFDDGFAFPSDSFLFSKPRRTGPHSRVHIFFDDARRAKDEKECEFSTVIRFSSSSEPGKSVSTTKTTTTTKVIDGKKIVVKRTEDNGKETIETYEDGRLTSQVVQGTAVAAN
ncbi:unnamed protein product, partial [Mesorhabditis belari]|uniref:J domain-containing protein n=1 Tax=Mesorhabditis belari TaxID=2138241 RepID=A0AAF3EAJ7_9BILA